MAGRKIRWRGTHGCVDIVNPSCFADICRDNAALHLIKTGQFPLGMTAISKSRIRRLCNKYYWDDDLQMLTKRAGKKYGSRLVPDPGEREALIRDVHGLGHMGIARVAGAIVNNYFWAGMHSEVKQVLLKCSCLANRRKLTIVAPLKPTLIPMAPFDLVAIDLMTLTRSYGGNRYLITAQDFLSKWPESKTVPTKSAAEVAEFIEEFIFSRFGCPIELITDQGREFLGEVNRLTRGRVIHRTTSAYRAQANGMVEHVNSVTSKALAATIENGDIRSWEAGLRDFLTGYRGFRHSTTGKSPHQILMGRPMRLP